MVVERYRGGKGCGEVDSESVRVQEAENGGERGKAGEGEWRSLAGPADFPEGEYCTSISSWNVQTKDTFSPENWLVKWR